MRNVVLTGAASGIGFDTALRFIANGDRVIACDRDMVGLEALEKAAVGMSGEVVKTALDLMDLDTFDGVEAAVAAQDRLDVLVNCAGICSGTPLDEIDPREWDRTYAVNIRGPFFLTQRLMKYLKKGEKPCVVNVSSMAGYTGGIQSNPAYSSSKAAVTCTTKNLAKFLAPYGIRVNEVSPGTAQTQMTMNWLGEDGLKPFAERVPLGRVAVAEDIGKVIFFLASDAAGFITGQSIQVNGGMYIP